MTRATRLEVTVNRSRCFGIPRWAAATKYRWYSRFWNTKHPKQPKKHLVKDAFLRGFEGVFEGVFRCFSCFKNDWYICILQQTLWVHGGECAERRSPGQWGGRNSIPPTFLPSWTASLCVQGDHTWKRWRWSAGGLVSSLSEWPSKMDLRVSQAFERTNPQLGSAKKGEWDWTSAAEHTGQQTESAALWTRWERHNSPLQTASHGEKPRQGFLKCLKCLIKFKEFENEDAYSESQCSL